jgi:hypothetical protein
MPGGMDIPVTGVVGGRPVPPYEMMCPACGAPNIVHVENYNCCFECGRKMFVSPAEQEARLRHQDRPADQKQESHGAYAVEMTFKVIAWVIGIGTALYFLAYSWPILVAGAIILAPIYLFFNIKSRLRARRPQRQAVAPFIDIRLDPTPESSDEDGPLV